MKSYKILFFLVFLFVIQFACNRDKLDGTEKELFDMVENTSAKTWYKNSDALLETSEASGHSQPYMRVWYNTEASTVLNDSAKVIENAKFPEGSLVVKELFADRNSLDVYAILYKEANHVDADTNGWVWGYIYSDQRIKEPSANKGDACISCHSQSGSIDYMLMNKYFP